MYSHKATDKTNDRANRKSDSRDQNQANALRAETAAVPNDCTRRAVVLELLPCSRSANGYSPPVGTSVGSTTGVLEL
jgi:hypothetical protein